MATLFTLIISGIAFPQHHQGDDDWKTPAKND